MRWFIGKKLWLVGLGVVVLGAGLAFFHHTFRAAEVSTFPDGSIAIPGDLKGEFDRAWGEVEAAEATIRLRAPLLEQIVRISMDRAGVKPVQFVNYEFDKTCKCIKPKPGK